MSDQVREFVEQWLPVQHETGRAVHSGDAEPWLAVWSRQDPVSVFGAGVRQRSGWADVLRTIQWVASRFSDCPDYSYELVSADVRGEVAYTCGFERYTAVMADGRRVTTELRVTQIYRRESGGWRIVHRHGDHPPADPADTGG